MPQALRREVEGYLRAQARSRCGDSIEAQDASRLEQEALLLHDVPVRRRAVFFLLGLVVAFAWWLTHDEPAPRLEPTAPRAEVPARARLDRSAQALPPPAPHLRGSARAREDAPPTPGEVVDAGDLGELLDADRVRAWLRTNAEAAERDIDAFCEESRRVGKWVDVGARPRTRRHDAAYYMAIRSDWEGGRIGLLHLPEALTQRMNQPSNNWLTFTPADLAGLDFSWLQELAQFDHWSLTADGPLRDLETIDFREAPLPNYLTLVNWAKLRLIQARHAGDLAQASLEVRHLGDLIASSDVLLGEMIRWTLLRVERRVWEAAGLEPPAMLPSEEDAQEMRAILFAGMYYLYPGVRPDVRAKALGCMPAPCVALNEGLVAAAQLREVVPEASAQREWLLAQSNCDEGFSRRLSQSPPPPLRTLVEDFQGEPGVGRWMRVARDRGL